MAVGYENPILKIIPLTGFSNLYPKKMSGINVSINFGSVRLLVIIHFNPALNSKNEFFFPIK